MSPRTKNPKKPQGRNVAARERKELDIESTDLAVRFALRLRELLKKKNLGPSEFTSRLQAAGVEVSAEAVKKWISGDRMPRPQDLEAIADVLSVKDYRHLLPPPIR